MEMRRILLIALLVLTAVVPALPVHAQSATTTATTSCARKAEPWLPPKYKSPRGTREHVVIPPPAPAPPAAPTVPPPLYVPETGRLLPNLPTATARA